MPVARRRVWEMVGAADAAFYIGVSVRTLNRYQRDGIVTPNYTPGGHRRFKVAALRKLRDLKTRPHRRKAKQGQTRTRPKV